MADSIPVSEQTILAPDNIIDRGPHVKPEYSHGIAVHRVKPRLVVGGKSNLGGCSHVSISSFFDGRETVLANLAAVLSLHDAR